MKVVWTGKSTIRVGQKMHEFYMKRCTVYILIDIMEYIKF